MWEMAVENGLALHIPNSEVLILLVDVITVVKVLEG